MLRKPAVTSPQPVKRPLPQQPPPPPSSTPTGQLPSPRRRVLYPPTGVQPKISELVRKFEELEAQLNGLSEDEIDSPKGRHLTETADVLKARLERKSKKFPAVIPLFTVAVSFHFSTFLFSISFFFSFSHFVFSLFFFFLFLFI